MREEEQERDEERFCTRTTAGAACSASLQQRNGRCFRAKAAAPMWSRRSGAGPQQRHCSNARRVCLCRRSHRPNSPRPTKEMACMAEWTGRRRLFSAAAGSSPIQRFAPTSSTAIQSCPPGPWCCRRAVQSQPVSPRLKTILIIQRSIPACPLYYAPVFPVPLLCAFPPLTAAGGKVSYLADSEDVVEAHLDQPLQHALRVREELLVSAAQSQSQSAAQPWPHCPPPTWLCCSTEC